MKTNKGHPFWWSPCLFRSNANSMSCLMRPSYLKWVYNSVLTHVLLATKYNGLTKTQDNWGGEKTHTSWRDRTKITNNIFWNSCSAWTGDWVDLPNRHQVFSTYLYWKGDHFAPLCPEHLQRQLRTQRSGKPGKEPQLQRLLLVVTLTQRVQMQRTPPSWIFAEAGDVTFYAR